MSRFIKFAVAAFLANAIATTAQAAFVGMPMNLGLQVQRIRLETPTLPPLAHTRFCQEYPQDCRKSGVMFRSGRIDLTRDRQRELVLVNSEVNAMIKPEPNLLGIAGEKWLIAPSSGDCNDYAVTKRHELLARGWPAASLLLAEVVTTWGEHHLVLVVRTRTGDLVVDNLNANIKPWTKANYRWVRIQTPGNPMFWAKVGDRTV